MTDALAVMLSTDRPQAVDLALDAVGAALAMEMEAHMYFTGDAVLWVGRPGGAEAGEDGGEAVRARVAERIRELREDGAVHVYACSRAMKAHGIARDGLTEIVDTPAGFAYFLEVAGSAATTLSF